MSVSNSVSAYVFKRPFRSHVLPPSPVRQSPSWRIIGLETLLLTVLHDADDVFVPCTMQTFAATTA